MFMYYFAGFKACVNVCVYLKTTFLSSQPIDTCSSHQVAEDAPRVVRGDGNKVDAGRDWHSTNWWSPVYLFYPDCALCMFNLWYSAALYHVLWILYILGPYIAPSV